MSSVAVSRSRIAPALAADVAAPLEITAQLSVAAPLEVTGPLEVTALQRMALWLELTKPRIAVMVLLTVAAGALATGHPLQAQLLLHVVLGTAAVAGGASALNQWWERHSDARMPRTMRRPLPARLLSSSEALAFGLGLSLVGAAWLLTQVRFMAALLAIATWLLYVLVYTPLKRITPSNTAVGAVAGALPVLIGWTAAGGPLDWRAAAWFMIVYLWQFPHFMAIAWLYRHDYAAAGMRMLPVVEPTGRVAGLQSLAVSVALLPVSLLPLAAEPRGGLFALAVVALGLGYVATSARFCLRREDRTARVLLRYSLLYLPATLLLLVGGSW